MPERDIVPVLEPDMGLRCGFNRHSTILDLYNPHKRQARFREEEFRRLAACMEQLAAAPLHQALAMVLSRGVFEIFRYKGLRLGGFC